MNKNQFKGHANEAKGKGKVKEVAGKLASHETRSVLSARQSDLSDHEEHGEIIFRKFQPAGDDEKQMRDLLFDNGFLGQPFDAICPHKKWFCDVVLTPYIEHQKENIHVAVHKPSGRLIGHLTGSTGGQEFEKTQYNWVRKQVVSLAVSFAMPWTFFDHTSHAFATHVIFKGEGERPSHPDTGVHWHYQVDRDFRGQGVGRRLLRRFADDALKADFRLIWAEVMAYPDRPPEYFTDRGWSIYDVKPTMVFGSHVDFPVDVMCVSKTLSSIDGPADPL